jgi:hypothetical protein
LLPVPITGELKSTPVRCPTPREPTYATSSDVEAMSRRWTETFQLSW